MSDQYYEFDGYGFDAEDEQSEQTPMSPEEVRQILSGIHQPYMFSYVHSIQDTRFINGQVRKSVVIAVNSDMDDALDMITGLMQSCSRSFGVPDSEILSALAMRILR